MPTYRYEGFNAAGAPKTGRVDAASEGDASAKCRNAGLFLQKLEPDGADPMKTVLHHKQQQEDVFLDTNEEPIIDRPRIHTPNEGQNYAPAWTPTWRNQAPATVPTPGVVNEPRDTQTYRQPLESWQQDLAEKIHEIALFYKGSLEILNQTHSGPFPDLLKEALNATVLGLAKNAYSISFYDQKHPPETKKPSVSAGSNQSTTCSNLGGSPKRKAKKLKSSGRKS
jgi:hypothetical protein